MSRFEKADQRTEEASRRSLTSKSESRSAGNLALKWIQERIESRLESETGRKEAVAQPRSQILFYSSGHHSNFNTSITEELSSLFNFDRPAQA